MLMTVLVVAGKASRGILKWKDRDKRSQVILLRNNKNFPFQLCKKEGCLGKPELRGERGQSEDGGLWRNEKQGRQLPLWRTICPPCLWLAAAEETPMYKLSVSSQCLSIIHALVSVPPEAFHLC